ncbi:unnamed protein product, partial [Linum tenue]
ANHHHYHPHSHNHHEDTHRNHHEVHRHHHNHGRGHHHHHHGDEFEKLTGAQKAVIRFSDAVRWTNLASLPREEHLQLCCYLAAMFLAAVICPYLAPKSVD